MSDHRNRPSSTRDRIAAEWRTMRGDLSWIAAMPLHVWLRLLLVPMLVGVWWGVARVAPAGFFAGPGVTIDALFTLLTDRRHELLIALGWTLSVYFSGLFLAALIGIPLGLLLGSISLIGRTVSPFVNALAATPVVALIPLIILSLGLGWQAKVAIVALTAVMPVLIGAQTGARNVDPGLIEMARTCRLSAAQRLWIVRLPAAFPAIMAGLRLGAVTGLVAAAIADIYTAMTGLGALLLAYGNGFRIDAYFAVVLCFAAIGAGTTGLLTLMERCLTPPPERKRISN